MSPYNIEFFDLMLNNKHHDTILMPDVDDDYLAPQSTVINIAKTDKVKVHDVVYFSGNLEYFAIVDSVDIGEHLTSISIKPFISIFDQDIMFDTNTQGTKALETTIADIMKQYWLNSNDSQQNIPSLNIVTTSSNIKFNGNAWGFNLKSESEDHHNLIVGFYSSIISKAMTKYGVAISATPNFYTKKIDIKIGTISDAITIESDLPGISIDTFIYKKASSNVNKLEIWNSENYTEKIYYYLHEDGSFNTVNNNRITPVILELATAAPERDSNNSITKTFAKAAEEVASDKFSGIEWNNLIEITARYDDRLVNGLDLKIGQTVIIIHDGTAYSSILTGKKYSNTLQLIFGTVRQDLTKILRREGK